MNYHSQSWLLQRTLTAKLCNMENSSKPLLIEKYVNNDMSLCLRWTRKVRKMASQKFGRFCILMGLLKLKKIPENFFHWYHLAWFFQMKILKKMFLAKAHQEGPKIGCSQKKFFCKMTRKTLRTNFCNVCEIF